MFYVVPNYVGNAIGAALDAEIAKAPDAAKDARRTPVAACPHFQEEWMSFGLSIVQVEPGTIIENEHGHKLTVTDDNAVHRGGAVYLTPKNYEALRTTTLTSIMKAADHD